MLWGWHQSLPKGHSGIPAVPKGVSAHSVQLVVWPVFLTERSKEAWLNSKIMAQSRAATEQRPDRGILNIFHSWFFYWSPLQDPGCQKAHLDNNWPTHNTFGSLSEKSSPRLKMSSNIQEANYVHGLGSAWSLQHSHMCDELCSKKGQRNKQLNWEPVHRLQLVLENIS